jgi:hypothetical protein
LWYYRLLNNGGPLTWEQFVLLVTVRFGPQFTGKPHNTPALGGDVLFEATAEGDDALQADDSSDERGVGSNDVLAVGKGDDAVHVDDGSCALRLDIGSNTSSSGAASMHTSPVAIWLWVVPSTQATAARAASTRVSWPAVMAPSAEATVVSAHMGSTSSRGREASSSALIAARALMMVATTWACKVAVD